MRKLAKWIAIATGGLVLLLLLVAVAVLVLGQRTLNRRYDIAGLALDIRTDRAAVARGAHLAHVLGCYTCHGDRLEGAVLVDDPLLGRLIAPNVTGVRASYDDADFERLLRHGVRPNGTSVVSAMPSMSFASLADEDVAAIIAYMRSVPVVDNPLPDTRLRLLAKAMLVVGRFPMPAAEIDHQQPTLSTYPRESETALGEYLARAICTECHGPDLRGRQDFMTTPDLAIAASYSREDFGDLMRTGTARGDRDLTVMSAVSERFSHFSDAEIDALYAYFTARATGDTTAL